MVDNTFCNNILMKDGNRPNNIPLAIVCIVSYGILTKGNNEEVKNVDKNK